MPYKQINAEEKILRTSRVKAVKLSYRRFRFPQCPNPRVKANRTDRKVAVPRFTPQKKIVSRANATREAENRQQLFSSTFLACRETFSPRFSFISWKTSFTLTTLAHSFSFSPRLLVVLTPTQLAFLWQWKRCFFQRLARRVFAAANPLTYFFAVSLQKQTNCDSRSASQDFFPPDTFPVSRHFPLYLLPSLFSLPPFLPGFFPTPNPIFVRFPSRQLSRVSEFSPLFKPWEIRRRKRSI